MYMVKTVQYFFIILFLVALFYNINEDVIKWIEAYLDNMTQRVKINNSYSNKANVISGISQGSI